MRRTTCLSLLILIGLVFLPGCYFAAGLGKAPWKKDQEALAAANAKQDPPILGEWSEPVNSVRMMAVPLASSPTMPGRRIVLIYAENVGEEPVSLPSMRAPAFVTPLSQRTAKALRPDPDANLRLEYELLNGMRAQYDFNTSHPQDELEEITHPMMPGEIRVSAILLNMNAEQMQHALEMLRQQEVPVSEVYWSIGVHESTPARLRLSYRPEGFDPEHKRSLQDAEHWRGKQIDLPPIEIMIRPWRDGERIQELNG